MDVWPPVEALATVATAGLAVVATFQARSSARDARKAAERSNAAADTLAEIESQRRKSELCPQFRVICELWAPGMQDILRLRVMLIGPPGLDRLDRLTVTIRDDHFRRGEHQQIMGGPTEEEVKQHIWGPYRLAPGIGPDNTQANETGRLIVYDSALPIGEELPFQLDRTRPGHWMTGTSPEDWQRQRGRVMRLALTVERDDYGPWYLPCEIDTSTLPCTARVPQDLA